MPQFVIEVTSESTWRDDVEAKRDLYLLAGVREYVVFDPTGEFLTERVRGWQAGEDGWQLWLPVADLDDRATWRSDVLGLTLRVEGPLLRFDHPASGPLLLRREAMRHWRTAQQAREAAEQAREAAERRAEAAEQALRDLQRQLRQGEGR